MKFNNQFGMFIHWGIYACTKEQEQVFARNDIDRAEYESLKDQFNPVLYNPEEWVLAAKKAGMKYICFTTKHHDGFCMWDTKYSDYNIMNTPYGKDVLKELAEACRKHDMKLSLYYSNPDWHHEYGYNPNSTHQWKAKNENLKVYMEYERNQITELLTGYGNIYTLFWDIPPCIEDRSMNELVRSLQPDILINDRGFDPGDFSTPERELQTENSRYPHMTEACDSIGAQSWGYRETEDYHSIRYLTTAIDRVMARGGSFLLNVGPKADGTFPQEATEILNQVGDWYNRMEGCLEDTEVDEYPYAVRNSHYVVNKKNGKSYFHFYDGINSSAVSFSKYPALPASVRLVNTGKELEFGEELLPRYFDMNTGKSIKHLHIRGIPTNELSQEPVVLEICWPREDLDEL